MIFRRFPTSALAFANRAFKTITDSRFTLNARFRDALLVEPINIGKRRLICTNVAKLEQFECLNEASLTPLLFEIRAFVRQYPEHVVFTQVGEFFEIYNVTSPNFWEITSLLDLSTPRKANSHVHMSGFKATGDVWKKYVSRLLEAGKSVVLVEQTEPVVRGQAVKRAVTRVFSPGTQLDFDIEVKNSRFILAIFPKINSEYIALAWLDVVSREFVVGASDKMTLEMDIDRIAPVELIALRSHHEQFPALFELIPEPFRQRMHLVEQDIFNGRSCTGNLSRLATHEVEMNQFDEEQVLAAGALLNYIKVHDKDLDVLRLPVVFERASTLAMEASTAQHLSLRLITAQFKDIVRTNMGARLAGRRLRAPFCILEDIDESLDLIEFFQGAKDLSIELVDLLSSIDDIPKLLTKLESKRIKSPQLLVSLFQSIQSSLDVKNLLETHVAKNPSLHFVAAQIHDFEALVVRYRGLFEEVSDIGNERVVQRGFSVEVDSREDILFQLDGAKAELCDEIGRVYQSKVELKEIGQYGAVCEFRRSKMLQSKFFATDIEEELVMLESHGTKTHMRHKCSAWTGLYQQINDAQAAFRDAQLQVFDDAVRDILKYRQSIRETAKAIAELDLASSVAEMATREKWVRPRFVKDAVLDIRGGWHLLVTSTQFVPNDTYLGPGGPRVILLTGANMSGKSTFLRQTALIVVLAHAGFYVPAESCRLGLVDKIFSRVGAGDDLENGKSTFMVEMEECAQITRASANSLAIIDECGRGTAPNEGAALAKAIVEYLAGTVRCRTIFTTHFLDLAKRIESTGVDGVECWHSNLFVREDGTLDIVYKLERGVARSSHAIDIARMAGAWFLSTV